MMKNKICFAPSQHHLGIMDLSTFPSCVPRQCLHCRKSVDDCDQKFNNASNGERSNFIVAAAIYSPAGNIRDITPGEDQARLYKENVKAGNGFGDAETNNANGVVQMMCLVVGWTVLLFK